MDDATFHFQILLDDFKHSSILCEHLKYTHQLKQAMNVEIWLQKVNKEMKSMERQTLKEIRREQ